LITNPAQIANPMKRILHTCHQWRN